jgi:hypothetical protein
MVLCSAWREVFDCIGIRLSVFKTAPFWPGATHRFRSASFRRELWSFFFSIEFMYFCIALSTTTWLGTRCCAFVSDAMLCHNQAWCLTSLASSLDPLPPGMPYSSTMQRLAVRHLHTT